MRGKARISGTACEACRDHPRLCGEKFSARIFKYLSMGSPPPMRGKGKKETRSFKTAGITPAYAGKSANYSVIFTLK